MFDVKYFKFQEVTQVSMTFEFECHSALDAESILNNYGFLSTQEIEDSTKSMTLKKTTKHVYLSG